MNTIELFCEIDDFCQESEPQMRAFESPIVPLLIGNNKSCLVPCHF